MNTGLAGEVAVAPSHETMALLATAGVTALIHSAAALVSLATMGIARLSISLKSCVMTAAVGGSIWLKITCALAWTTLSTSER